ncbi:MAG: DUF192 domain-containing protein [Giesbergeria sp.]
MKFLPEINQTPVYPVVQLTRGPALTVELARTPLQRARGLQYRRWLEENHGMLFCFPSESIHTFHMLNTLVSLDILHFNRDGVLVGFIDSATPLSTEPLTSPVASTYVLEVKAGWRKRHGVHIGDRMFFDPRTTPWLT